MRILIAVASASLALAAPLAPALARRLAVSPSAPRLPTPMAAPVGTVTAVNGDIVTIKTDKLEANLSKSSFAEQEGKLLIGMTQAELNAAIEKDKAAADASLAVGADRSRTAPAPLPERSRRSTPTSSRSSSHRASRSACRAPVSPAAPMAR